MFNYDDVLADCFLDFLNLLTIVFLEMADNCVVCERTLRRRRRRRHVLSRRFLETRRDFAEHILRTIEPPREVCVLFFYSLIVC